MRIALMCSFEFTTPPPTDIIYPPLTVMAKLADGLVDRGHEVTIFGAEGTDTKARCISGGLHSLAHYEEIKDSYEGTREKERRDRFITMCDQYLLGLLYRMAQDGAFDIIHIHPPFPQNVVCFAPLISTPTTVTLHDPANALWHKFLFPLYEYAPQLSFVSISRTQRRALPDLNYAGIVYNGIEVSDYPFNPTPGEHLLFAGRLVPEKGVAEAVHVARKANEKLLIAGSRTEQDYFDAQVKRFLGEDIQFLGMVNFNEMPRLYRRSKALVFPIKWEEPFGLVMVEAMACGTPVIAFRRGSVPEIVVDGKTGFIVDNEEEMVEAVKQIDTIDRAECRKHVERNFSVERMVDEYANVYSHILELGARR